MTLHSTHRNSPGSRKLVRWALTAALAAICFVGALGVQGRAGASHEIKPALTGQMQAGPQSADSQAQDYSAWLRDAHSQTGRIGEAAPLPSQF